MSSSSNVEGGGAGEEENLAAKRYTKKPRQTFVSSSLDPLALSAAVTRVFVY
jgi:hypothetical protein